MRLPTLLVLVALGLGGCSGTSGNSGSSTAGGSSGTSAFATGGMAAGGGNATGGVSAAGGSLNQGGAVAAGGTRATGGMNATGGMPNTGGIQNVGGSIATGGKSSTGGAATSGGTPSAGGTVNTGGSKSTGGAVSTGGAATGGTRATGETPATGGAKATGGTTATGGASGSSNLLVPAQGALLGAFVGTGTFAQLETTLGRKLAIIHNFFGWSDDWVARVPGDLSDGRIPLITWETWVNGVGIPLDDILSGVYDSMITTRATAAKNVGQKFFLRWGHEMNGNWYPWDGYHNGANAAATAKYISVYHHIHDIFVNQGATNVLWVFCPNVDSVPGDAWNQWANYYPGDTYVDWMGFDGYNWGTSTTGGTWQSFTSIASRIYSGLAAKNKPIMIPETASSELGGDKAAWIAGVVPALKSSYPSIRALVWFDMNKETDWRMDSSAPATTASITMANDPNFNP